MTFEDWLYAAKIYHSKNPQQRKGQAYFNSLYSHEPELADFVRATGLDPFYDDDRIVNFLMAVEKAWS